MASSTNYPSCGLKVAAIFIVFLINLPSKPGSRSVVKEAHDNATLARVGLVVPSYKSESVKQMEKLVGSKPPECENRCLGCRTCTPTLVISTPHQWKAFKELNYKEGDHVYYPLSWNCKCGNKFFHP